MQDIIQNNKDADKSFGTHKKNDPRRAWRGEGTSKTG